MRLEVGHGSSGYQNARWGYMTRLAPSFGDNPDDVAFKFNQFEKILSDASGFPIPEKKQEKKEDISGKSNKRKEEINVAVGQPTDTQGPSDLLDQSRVLAKQALIEKDPLKKRALLDKS